MRFGQSGKLAVRGGSFAPQRSHVIENFLSRITRLIRCHSPLCEGHVFVGEPVGYVPEMSPSRVTDLNAFRCFGDELGLLVVYNSVFHKYIPPGTILTIDRSQSLVRRSPSRLSPLPTRWSNPTFCGPANAEGLARVPVVQLAGGTPNGLQGEPAIMSRSDSDLAIAKAWERLRLGNFADTDVPLLRHEATEANRIRRWGPGYSKAHDAAERRYPAPKLEENPRDIRSTAISTE